LPDWRLPPVSPTGVLKHVRRPGGSACAEDTKCSLAGQLSSGELAEIEALVARADRLLLSVCQGCGFHHLAATIEHDVDNARKWLQDAILVFCWE